MKTNTKNAVFQLALATVFFYVGWGIPQFFNKYNLLSPVINNWFFSVVFTGIAGCIIPLRLRNKYHIKYTLQTTAPNKLTGLLFLGLSLVFGLIFSGALMNTFQLGYTAIMVLKYIFLFFPMALGISLFAFLLLPGFIGSMDLNKTSAFLVTIFLTGGFFFVGFFIDSTFDSIELGITMAFLGVFFGLSHWFTKNFWITFAGFFVTMLFNTLSEDKYCEYPLIIVLTSTAISLAVLMADVLGKRAGQNDCRLRGKCKV